MCFDAMHERFICNKVSGESDIMGTVSEYCQVLLKIADECGCEGVTANLTLQVEGEEPVKSSEDMGKFLETLWQLELEPKPFIYDGRYSGRLAEKNWVTDKNGKRHRLHLPITSFSNGLAGDICFCDDHIYKSAAHFSIDGAWTFVKVENGEETTYDLELFTDKQAFGSKVFSIPSKKYFTPLTTSVCGDWEEHDTCMWVLVDEEKHPGVMEQLYAIMEKHLPAQAAESAKEGREWDAPNGRDILCACSYLEPQDILELQPLLDELNAVLLPIKEDIVYATTEGYWLNMDDFQIATWVWTEEGFQIWSMTY